MKNAVHLITYTERLAQGDINQLSTLLTDELNGLFAGVHLLPFFFPIDGSDAGFDPVDHLTVDSRLGDWSQVKALTTHAEVMADVIVNHMSSQASQFVSVLEAGEQSPFWALFLKPNDVFAEADSPQRDKIYSPRPGECFTDYKLADNRSQTFWTTFTDNQVDINVESPQGKAYLLSILDKMQSAGVSTVRLDAAGFAIKRADTSCFMLPETVEFITNMTQKAHQRGIETLVEIHGTFRQISQVAEKADYVYDFMLPPLVLHALINHDVSPLLHWYDIAPENMVTVLDTHDGIGLLDAGPDSDGKGLLSMQALHNLRERIAHNCQGESELASGENAENVDIWQVNCSFYSALAQNDAAYLIARAIQFFSLGIPQVYYAGLYALPNDMELLKQSGIGRDINRPYVNNSQRQQAMQTNVVKAQIELIELRNNHPAFHGGFSAKTETGLALKLTRYTDEQTLHLCIAEGFEDAWIVYSSGGTTEQLFTVSERLAQTS